jgi:hypothetical protein
MIRFVSCSGIAESDMFFPGGFSVSANPSSSFTFLAPTGGCLTVFDVTGRVVAEEELLPGEEWFWNNTVEAGVYLVCLTYNGCISVRRVVLCR